jgi:hypothetical protein
MPWESILGSFVCLAIIFIPNLVKFLNGLSKTRATTYELWYFYE